MNETIPVFFVAFLVAAFAVLLGVCIRVFVLIRLWTAMLGSLVINIFSTVWLTMSPPGKEMLRVINNNENATAPDHLIRFVAVLAAANMGVALLAKLYRAAILNKVTTEERATGVDGLRAWLPFRNVFAVLLFAAAAWVGLDFNFFSALILATCAILIYPLTNTLLHIPQSTASPLPPAPAEERQRVLALVEAGKISAEDGSDLLTALAQSHVSSAEPAAVISGPRRVILAGAAVVLLGFFLPWFTVNAGQQMHEAVAALQQNFSQMPGMTPQNLSQMQQSIPGLNPTQTQASDGLKIVAHGGDVADGIGWMILLAGVGVAALPFFWAPRSDNLQHQRNSGFALISAGSVALLYVLSNCFNAAISIEVGLLFVILGYALIWFGMIRTEMAGRPALHPSLAIA